MAQRWSTWPRRQRSTVAICTMQTVIWAKSVIKGEGTLNTPIDHVLPWFPQKRDILIDGPMKMKSSLMENGEKPTECLAGPCRTTLSGFRCRDHQLLRTKWDCGSIMHIIGSSGGEEKVVEVPHAQSNNAFNGRERSKNPIFENEAECPTKISFVLYISCDDLGIILKCLHVCMSTDWLFPLKWLKLVPVPDRQWYEKGIAVSVLWVERFAAASFYNPMIKNHPAAAAAASTAAIAAL